MYGLPEDDDYIPSKEELENAVEKYLDPDAPDWLLSQAEGFRFGIATACATIIALAYKSEKKPYIHSGDIIEAIDKVKKTVLNKLVGNNLELSTGMTPWEHKPSSREQDDLSH